MTTDSLPSDHIFSHANLMVNPKEAREATFNDIRYETLHTGGFLRLCTLQCRVYWCEQNVYLHCPPDWKIHFSVAHEDLAVAWDIVAHQFIAHKFQSGMKVTYAEPESWPEMQRGREITVYIYRHDERYSKSEVPPNLRLTPDLEQTSEQIWSFIRDCERALHGHGIRSRGCAGGDRPLGKYASLRNEAYVMTRYVQVDGLPVTEPMMPTNKAGWNATRHKCPLSRLPWSASEHKVLLFGATLGLIGCYLAMRSRRK
eukprot:c27163_g1_i1.p1 GENE.c27163_g1_i1~~c27163_g1_i1.p1  ORF type:complete len:284 (-),score=31.36 c27163_g1_i1:79-849(-)